MVEMGPGLLLELGCEKLKPNNEIADEFSYLFYECVEDTLTDLLGSRVREGLLDYMERQARLARSDLLEHPSELSKLLSETLESGGIEIEKCIMRRLYTALGWKFKESSNFNFPDQVEEARAHWKTASFTDTIHQVEELPHF